MSGIFFVLDISHFGIVSGNSPKENPRLKKKFPERKKNKVHFCIFLMQQKKNFFNVKLKNNQSII